MSHHTIDDAISCRFCDGDGDADTFNAEMENAPWDSQDVDLAWTQPRICYACAKKAVAAFEELFADMDEVIAECEDEAHDNPAAQVGDICRSCGGVFDQEPGEPGVYRWGR